MKANANALRAAIVISASVLAAATSACAPQPGSLPEVTSPAKRSTLHLEPVPRTLDEALDTLDRSAPGSVILEMRHGDESVAIELHDSLGLWIRNNWGLHGKGPLYRHLAALGLQYPDDMSGLILTSWWRRMHGLPLGVEQQASAFRRFNEEIRPPRSTR